MASDRRRTKNPAGGKRPSLRLTETEYTDDEKALIVRYLDTELTIPNLKDFLRDRDMPRSGNKPVLLATIVEGLHVGRVTHAELLDLLDTVLPWGPQHVFLLGEPQGLPIPLKTYQNRDIFEDHLRQNNASRPFRERLPLILPEALTVSSIVHSEDRLRVTAIERRDGFMRDEERDRWERNEHGQDIHLRAFVKEISRGLIMFDWDFKTNMAMLQVTRLPSGQDYEKAELRFQKLVGKWIDLSRFPTLDLRPVVKTLHEEAIKLGDKSRARPHGIEYDTMGGGRVEAKSATAQSSLMADTTAKEAIDVARKNGVGRMGNFYWREAPSLPEGHRGVHVRLMAKARRVHFPTGQSEEVVRHVLEEIRSTC